MALLKGWNLTPYSLDENTANGTELELHFTSVDFRCLIFLLYEIVFISQKWR
jgi:hypothetical protein